MRTASKNYAKLHGLEKKLVILLEEPEAHIFPFLIDYLVKYIEGALNTAYIVVATHNPLLVSTLWDKLQNVKTYYIYRDPAGATAATELNVEKLAEEMVFPEENNANANKRSNREIYYTREPHQLSGGLSMLILAECYANAFIAQKLAQKIREKTGQKIRLRHAHNYGREVILKKLRKTTRTSRTVDSGSNRLRKRNSTTLHRRILSKPADNSR